MSGHRQESCGHCGPLAGQTSQGHPSQATAEMGVGAAREVLLGVEIGVGC